MQKIEFCSCKVDFFYRITNPSFLSKGFNKIKYLLFGGQSGYAYHLGCGKPIRPANIEEQEKLCVHCKHFNPGAGDVISVFCNASDKKYCANYEIREEFNKPPK